MSTRVALVTGAARGIGQAIALRLAETGHEVAVGDMRPADETVMATRNAGGDAFAVACDLGTADGVDLLVRAVEEHRGHCDVLVNCAGLMLFRPFGELDLATWRRIQAVNVEAAFQLCAAFVPGMTERASRHHRQRDRPRPDQEPGRGRGQHRGTLRGRRGCPGR
jgi:NAD(P)-dependent dehydrogenase (short-subunit alcohol dehydrogenase family)